ncbi:glycosyl transferase [Listeria newyorkensis]|uniref:Glycosyl transferase n=1 Tax=Listeria newyorkensis TaxID=1497681 RepID=A0ABX4XK05_9LIST|nr:sugar transferase [Listeria newyorkensis]KGL37817.1 glycosyl transferase [Listeria newyorkensis]PNP90590.1 glycosyl transferase [Listeria newyorkensis]WAO20430.1 sugar transferase [Listeria newyorkensis]SQC56606.1 Putative colanic biosynthesis UDP-glucose lipid carrier transferase [Listeria newyorkensis]
MMAFMKRFGDIVLSVIGIVLTGPIMLVTALCIKLEDRGPVLFVQTRTGKDGEAFSIYKFRSMRVREMSGEHDYDWEHGVPDGFVFKDVTEENPHVTKVGAFIRKTSLDELPQFFNVLLGNMSFIGPRPEIPAITSCYSEQQRKRLEVKPGITGWAQVNGRSSVTNGEKMRLDYHYVENFSLRMDLVILLRTVVVVLKSRDAV